MTDLLDIDEKTLLGLSKEELRETLAKLRAFKQRAAQVGPQTPDELHEFIKEKYGVHIPRIAVTPGHDAPFDFICDAFFQWETSQLVIANREGAKTFSVALIHALMARFYPGYEGITAGAIEIQSKRCYSSFKSLNGQFGSDQVKDTLQSETNYKNGSKVEIVTMTYSAMNGPHSNLLHRDEVELARRDAFDEGDNITKSGYTRDGRQIKAHDILTSTRKKARGLVQELLDKVEAAVSKGEKPPYRVYKWGVAETIKRVENCRYHAAPGTPEEELCACPKYINGTMDDGSVRTLEKVCGGRFGKSDGWRPLEPDIAGKFMKNSKAMWKAQQECSKVASEGLIYPNFSKETHGLRNYDPNPEHGKIYLGVDFGATHPSSAHWYQHTNQIKWATNYSGGLIFIPAGSYVAFDEVYTAELGNMQLAGRIISTEIDWQRKYIYFEVEERYADPAAKMARIDWRNHTPPLPTVWRVTREIEEHINLVQQKVDNMLFYVDVDRCPMLVSEMEAYQRDPKTGKPVDDFNHAMDELRYVVANVERKLQIEKHVGAGQDLAVAAEHERKGPAPPSTYDISTIPDAGPSKSPFVSPEYMQTGDEIDAPIHAAMATSPFDMVGIP